VLTVAKGGKLTHSKRDLPHYLYLPVQDN